MFLMYRPRDSLGTLEKRVNVEIVGIALEDPSVGRAMPRGRGGSWEFSIGEAIWIELSPSSPLNCQLFQFSTHGATSLPVELCPLPPSRWAYRLTSCSMENKVVGLPRRPTIVEDEPRLVSSEPCPIAGVIAFKLLHE